LIVSSTNISDATGHQTTVHVPASPSVCFCTTWENLIIILQVLIDNDVDNIDNVGDRFLRHSVCISAVAAT